MITLLVWVVLVIVACYVLAAVSILPLFYFVRIHHFRFGMPRQAIEPPSSSQVRDLERQRSDVSHDGSTALAAPLTDLELEDVITLEPEDWWEVDK